MNLFRFLRDLALIPEMWRDLVRRAKIAEAQKNEPLFSPSARDVFEAIKVAIP